MLLSPLNQPDTRKELDMDLMDLKPKSDVVVVELKHPSTLEPLTNDDGSVMSVTVYAQYSKQYRDAMYEQQDKRLEKMQKKGASSKYSSADLEADAVSLLASITKEWTIVYGGETPKVTIPKAKEIYTEVFWLRQQVEEGLSEALDFTKA